MQNKEKIKSSKNLIVKPRNRLSGITLIALVITIIIMLILVGVIISLVIQGGLFGRANEAAFKTRMSAYKEKVNLYTGWKIAETMNTDTSGINSGKTLKELIKEGIINDITEEDVVIGIKEILDDINGDEEKYIVVYKGEMCYVLRSDVENSQEQAKWCREIGIRVIEYVEPEGIIVKNGNYELVNGIYLCTPKLDIGFKQEITRYLEVDDNGKLIPGNWIINNPTESWYDYKNGKWANIYVEESGIENYYVWIPRYCFKLNQENERSDVKFIDINNNYKDENGNITTWEGENGLEEQGYQIPEAFTFNGTDLAGYWAMKYTLGDIITPSTVNYDMLVLRGQVTISNVTLNTSITNANPIVKYTIALNGNIVDRINAEDINREPIKFSGIRNGNNTINVTGLNANGEIVGSMTKEYAPTVVNKPELSKFNQDTTFYVTYDENGKETSTIPIRKEAPAGWYEYGEGRWANIVIRNDGLETYLVWIPRYEFTLDQTNERSTVKFILGTSTETTQGYQIPEAFTFNGTELTGYWAMKYTLGEEVAPRFDTEVVATSASIRTKGITGTEVPKTEAEIAAKSLVYKYYIDGQYKGERANASDGFEYTGLSTNTKYTILVEIRDGSNNLQGTIVKQITTIDANKPDLTGFNTKEKDDDNNKLPVAYYVLYDSQGNETIGDKVQNNGGNMPGNWYNYSESRWANIVITDGTITNNQISSDATKTTYLVWIPRYEFKITSSQYKQLKSARTEVRFLQGITTQTDEGYQIPEAFTFNGIELTGYWTTKYTIGE